MSDSVQVVNNEAEIRPVFQLMSWVEMWSITTMITFSTHDTHQIPFLYIITSDLQPLASMILSFIDDIYINNM